MKKTQLGLILGLTSTLATLTTITPAQAFTWTVNATSTNPAATITGSFTIDDESLGAGATVTLSSVTVGAVTYDDNATITVGGVGSIDSISWDFFAPSGTCTIAPCTLFLSFDPPGLTNAGGTVSLAGSTNFDQTATDGLVSDGTTTFAGGATATGGATGRVPFNFSTTPGLIVLGLIVGIPKGKKHLPKIKKKITSLLGKK